MCHYYLKAMTFPRLILIPVCSLRSVVIYHVVNYCGLPLKETGKRYGGITGTAVNKVASRFKERFAKDKDLQERLDDILSTDEM